VGELESECVFDLSNDKKLTMVDFGEGRWVRTKPLKREGITSPKRGVEG
jgi:hypothetical protein